MSAKEVEETIYKDQLKELNELVEQLSGKEFIQADNFEMFDAMQAS